MEKLLNVSFQNNDSKMRSSEKKLTNSFTDNQISHRNFLEKAAILKHFVKKLVDNRNNKTLKNSRSIREDYKKKVQQNNKIHEIINNGIFAIVKERKSKPRTSEKEHKNPNFLRKPTRVHI